MLPRVFANRFPPTTYIYEYQQRGEDNGPALGSRVIMLIAVMRAAIKYANQLTRRHAFLHG